MVTGGWLQACFLANLVEMVDVKMVVSLRCGKLHSPVRNFKGPSIYKECNPMYTQTYTCVHI